MGAEFLKSIKLLCEEKGLSEEYILEALEQGLIKAYKKSSGGSENVKVEFDMKKGKIKLYAQKEVVEVENFINDSYQITIDDALKIKKTYKIGDTVNIEITPNDFGRVAAQTAKQVILERVRTAEKNNTFNEFYDKKGELISGIVQKSDDVSIIVDLGKLEGIILPTELLPGESYNVNDKVKAYIVDIKRNNKNIPQAMLSRTNAGFVRRLFEVEIPEIYEGLIEIKAVSRDAGSRTKIAVYSKDENIDPVGSCVGMKGMRIESILKELNGEKIDIVEWSEDIAQFIAASLSPAQVIAVDVNYEDKSSTVVVPDDQLSLAIGKEGQNVRLAAKLVNWKIDIKTETQIREQILE
ncbi:MAG: transcription termination/antitermination protein NusA [Clostridiales bacterium]|nr:transcription termination/antitermination protein NusA [Clostridiales bacterium]